MYIHELLLPTLDTVHEIILIYNTGLKKCAHFPKEKPFGKKNPMSFG